MNWSTLSAAMRNRRHLFQVLGMSLLRMLIIAAVVAAVGKGVGVISDSFRKHVRANIDNIIKPGLLISKHMGSVIEPEKSNDQEEGEDIDEGDIPYIPLPILSVGFTDATDVEFDFTGETSSRVVLAMKERPLQASNLLRAHNYQSLYDVAAELYSRRQFTAEFELLDSYVSDPPRGKLNEDGQQRFLNYLERHYLAPAVASYGNGQLEQAAWLANRAAQLVRAMDPDPLASSVTVESRVNAALLLEAIFSSPERTVTHPQEMKLFLEFMRGSGMLPSRREMSQESVSQEEVSDSETRDDASPSPDSMEGTAENGEQPSGFKEVVVSNDQKIIEKLKNLRPDEQLATLCAYFVGTHELELREFVPAYFHFTAVVIGEKKGHLADLARLGQARCLFWIVRKAKLTGDEAPAAEFARLNLCGKQSTLIPVAVVSLRRFATGLATPSYQKDIDYYVQELEGLNK
jgi:hypothetical protein